jgi:hypothetical protein
MPYSSIITYFYGFVKYFMNFIYIAPSESTLCVHVQGYREAELETLVTTNIVYLL